MANDRTERVQAILANAQREAQRLGHDYVGTEHLLLGLVEEGAGVGAEVLETLGVTPQRVREEVEAIATSNTASAATTSVGAELPLTPRALRALALAGEEMAFVGQSRVDSEHLLVGLLREPGGLAARVLQNLGLTLQQVGAEAFKMRLQLMTIVERAVRPVRATILWKRKRREEMLAHLTEIYDRERAELNEPAEAVVAAAQRFGDAAELARELDRSVSRAERVGYYMERGLAWRAPETVVHYAWRLAVQTVVLLAPTLCAVIGIVAAIAGWSSATRPLLLVFAAILATTPPAVFALTWLHIKLRDAMWGAFGSAQSWRRVGELSLLIGLVGLAFGAGFSALAHQSLNSIDAMGASCAAAAVVLPLFSLVVARWDGPTEIRDSLWALLDLGQADAESETAS
jgi:hypothetical protein